MLSSLDIISTTHANAKHQTVNHLACDPFAYYARFRDAVVANSDTASRRLRDSHQ